MKSISKIISALTVAGVCCVADVGVSAGVRVDDLGVEVYALGFSREYSYSDKAAGFYYGMTGVNDWDNFYAGWNIRAKRIFSDYRLYVDGEALDRQSVNTVVYPDRLERIYPNAHEAFYMVDGRKVLYVEVDAVDGDTVGIELLGENISKGRQDGGSVVYDAKESAGNVVRVAAVDAGSAFSFDGNVVTSSAKSGGFVITFGTEEESGVLVDEFRKDGNKWLMERKDRMQALLDRNAISSDNEMLVNALSWIELTADELVTRQHGGWGIYAGFPWFTDFWGRDMFIAMPGIVLCTGQFDVARDILLSFAKYQDLNPDSETYGRVPNRLNLDGVLYNTTDGTPRFVMQVYDYLRYTGDKEFIKKIYKNVKIATDASIAKYTDDKGYLTHDDADTWMDARRQSKYPCSPRGNRAVDIQALWYSQLTEAAELADYMGEDDYAARWRRLADKLVANFRNDFVDKDNNLLYDHLNADGTPDRQLRPNTMYAYEMLQDDSVAMNDMRNLWSKLVYQWGVSTLDQYDDQFHPYHELWHRYHKDDAYHNGTVWLWLNGQAMQRMIEFGQAEKAYALFNTMLQQSMSFGAVGSLSECADAWLRPGQDWVRLSGTFLQAWSNGEQIRAWKQWFVGIRPDMLSGKVTVAPRLPYLCSDLEETVCVADGEIRFRSESDMSRTRYAYEWTGSGQIVLDVDIDLFSNFTAPLAPGARLEIDIYGDKLLAKVIEKGGGVRMTYEADDFDDEKAAYAQRCSNFFAGIEFAEPCYRENVKSLSRYFDPPLDYQSIE